MFELDEFTRAYIEAMLFADLPDEHTRTGFGVGDLEEGLLESCVIDCRDFQRKMGKLLVDSSVVRLPRDCRGVLELAGHDFWLTRQGHGSGFWDGDWKKSAGEALSKCARKFGSFSIGVDEDTYAVFAHGISSVDATKGIWVNPKILLPTVDCSRGAPMGRVSYGEISGVVDVQEFFLDCGGYDVGGAYWGARGGNDDRIYVVFPAEGSEANFRRYYSAANLQEVRDNVLKERGDVTFAATEAIPKTVTEIK